MNPPKAVVFDFGQVLSYPEKQSRIESMATICGLSVEAFGTAYRKYRPAYDRGTLKGVDYWRLLTADMPVELRSSDVESLIDLDTVNSIELNPSILRWAKVLLYNRLRIAILSNMTADDMERMRRDGILARLGMFEVKVFSSSVGLVKPEREIYEYCLTRLSLEPEETLFIDDKKENIDAACRLGMNAFLFQNTHSDLYTLSRQYNLPYGL